MSNPRPFDPELFRKSLKEAVSDVLEAKRDPRACSKCQEPLYGKDERESGICPTCEVASWSPEKRKSIQRLVAVGARKAFTDKPVSDAEIAAAVDEALKHDK